MDVTTARPETKSKIRREDDPFTYSALPAADRTAVRRDAVEIHRLVSRAAQDIVEVGVRLASAKARLPHGQFLPWLQAEFPNWSERTARNLMAVGERFKSANFVDIAIAPSALYLLAAPSTPEAAREDALEYASSGREVTHAVAKEIVESRKYPVSHLERLERADWHLKQAIRLFKSVPGTEKAIALVRQGQDELKKIRGRLMAGGA